MVSLVSLIALLPALAAAVPCVQFDSSFSLYAFGGDQDVKLGANTTWASVSPKTLTATGRPPWTGKNTQCMLSQNTNAMYVLGADAAKPGSVYIYDFAGDSWTEQTTSGAPPALQNSRSSAILDHDTNSIFTMAGDGGMLYELDMSAISSTAAGTLAWESVKTPPFSTDGYKVTAALSSNHINYFGVPGTPAGSADVFVIHYNYFQPQQQAYPAVSGSSFPASSGQAVGIPVPGFEDGPSQALFVPSDMSAAYVVTHWTALGGSNDTTPGPMAANLINSTQTLPAPPSKDAESAYACSDTACVQIDTEGKIHYITGAIKAYTVDASAAWKTMDFTLPPQKAVPNATTTAGGSTATNGSSSGGSATAGGDKTSAAPSSTSGTSNAAAAATIADSNILGAAVGFVALAIATVF